MIQAPGSLKPSARAYDSDAIRDLARDRGLVPAVERAAAALLARAPENAEPLTHRWVGDAVRYGGV